MLNRFRPRWMTMLFLVGLVGMAACGGGSDGSAPPSGGSGDRWTRVEPAALVQMLEKKDFTLVNVHVPYEGEIRGTDAFLPYDRITERLGELPSEDSKLVLYCRSGRMSTVAAQTLAERGYTKLYELSGGFDAWKASGQELVIDRERTATS